MIGEPMPDGTWSMRHLMCVFVTSPAPVGSMAIRAFSCEPVDVGSLYIRMAVATQITPAPVIGKDEQDVRLLSGTCRCNELTCNCQKNAGEYDD